jgi:hypothetical protein
MIFDAFTTFVPVEFVPVEFVELFPVAFIFFNSIYWEASKKPSPPPAFFT